MAWNQKMPHYLVNESHPGVGDKEIAGGIECHSLRRCKEGRMEVYDASVCPGQGTWS